jgi:predicted TIM-barrel fold metal-dependent hydrolase
MIIDCHTHIHPQPDGFGARCDASLAALLQELNAGQVDRAVVLPIAPMVSNEFVAEACGKYPDKLIGFASVEPLKGKAALEQLEQAVVELGLKGLKLHPRLQGFGCMHLASVVPIVERAADLKVPVLIDAFPYGSEVFRTRPIELINDLALAVPQVKLIMAHAGGHQLFDAMMVAKANRNIFLDISLTPIYYRGTSIESDLGFVIRKVGAERILYGSDHPDRPLRATFSQVLQILETYGLSSSQLDAILGNNLTELLA